DGLFAGVDTLLPSRARYAGLIDSARVQLNPTRPAAIAPLLGRALRELGAADSGQQAILQEALAAAAGVVIDGFADDGILIPGERVQLETSVWNAGDAAVTLDGIEVGAPAGWKVERLDPVSSSVPAGTLATRRFAVTVATGAVRSHAYFMRRPLAGAPGGLRHFTIDVTHRRRGPAVVQIAVTTPPGWTTLRPDSLSFEREDEAKSLAITVAPPAAVRPGVYQLKAAVLGGAGQRSDGALVLIDYPHIRPRAVVHTSTAELRAVRISLPALPRVGYVRGASDRVPEALQAVGVPIVLLGPDTLARGDLSRYDAIVIGSRAYETEPALVASNGRLLDYVRGGGLVIVQYQQYPFVNGAFAPYRLSIARPHDRVTDETAAVTVLDS